MLAWLSCWTHACHSADTRLGDFSDVVYVLHCIFPCRALAQAEAAAASVKAAEDVAGGVGSLGLSEQQQQAGTRYLADSLESWESFAGAQGRYVCPVCAVLLVPSVCVCQPVITVLYHKMKPSVLLPFAGPLVSLSRPSLSKPCLFGPSCWTPPPLPLTILRWTHVYPRATRRLPQQLAACCRHCLAGSGEGLASWFVSKRVLLVMLCVG